MVSKGSSTITSARHTTDFVWAIRLAKIKKGALRSRWDYATETEGALFDLDADNADLALILDQEGLARYQITAVESGYDLIDSLVV